MIVGIVQSVLPFACPPILRFLSRKLLAMRRLPVTGLLLRLQDPRYT
jgi:hypothetical protein